MVASVLPYGWRLPPKRPEHDGHHAAAGRSFHAPGRISRRPRNKGASPLYGPRSGENGPRDPTWNKDCIAQGEHTAQEGLLRAFFFMKHLPVSDLQSTRFSRTPKTSSVTFHSRLQHPNPPETPLHLPLSASGRSVRHCPCLLCGSHQALQPIEQLGYARMADGRIRTIGSPCSRHRLRIVPTTGREGSKGGIHHR